MLVGISDRSHLNRVVFDIVSVLTGEYTFLIDLTISSPESGGSGFEDQGRFRLSTSPLSHSSPSEISGNLSG